MVSGNYISYSLLPAFVTTVSRRSVEYASQRHLANPTDKTGHDEFGKREGVVYAAPVNPYYCPACAVLTAIHQGLPLTIHLRIVDGISTRLYGSTRTRQDKLLYETTMLLEPALGSCSDAQRPVGLCKYFPQPNTVPLPREF